MLALQVTRAVMPELATAALIVAASVLIRVITRMILCFLAAAAARKALEDLGGRPDAVAVRAHRLAVLQAILGSLAADDGTGLHRRAASWLPPGMPPRARTARHR